MKRLTYTRWAALLLSVMLLAACASSKNDTATAPSATPAASSATASRAMDSGYGNKAGESIGIMPQSAPEYSTAETPDQQLTTDRKVVRNGWMQLETKEFDKDLAAVIALIQQTGGYIERQSVSGASMSWKESYYERTASVTARIPAERFDEVLAGVGGICNVLSKEESTNDITDSYYDTDAHLSSLKLQEERLLEILSKAEKLEDVITLEQALSNVRYEIESLTASIRRMDTQVAYSSLSLDLNEVVEYQVPTEKPKTLGERLGAAWNRATENIGDSFESMLLFVVGDLPVLLVWLAVLGVIAWGIWRLWRAVAGPRLRRKKDEKPLPPKDLK